MDRSTAAPLAGSDAPSTLAAWLADLAQAGRPLVLFGGTGHLDLDADELLRVARELEQSVLPPLALLPPDVEVLFLTGLAPGADLVIAETARTWLTRQRRRSRVIGLLPVPREVLWDDWIARQDRAPALVATMRARFDLGLRDCDRIVQLWEPGSAPDFAQLEVRQRQYRRLAAVLAGHCDVLVAVLRPERRHGQPGGTAEVVAWREHRPMIPADLDPGPRRHVSGWPHGDQLIIVNPAGTPAALRQAREALRAGNYLLSYDLVLQAEREGPPSHELEYVKLQALANAGSTQAALRRFGELPPELRESDEDWLALAGRLHKDLGLRGGAGAQNHFRLAAACYRTALQRTGGYFSAVNAATTALLAGDDERATALARQVLEIVAQAPEDGERERYFLGATEAEAALLLGDAARARTTLERIDCLLSGDINARSRTRRQLRLVCRARGLDAAVVDALGVPPVVLLGPGTAELPRLAFAHVGITEPRELAAAERALAAGARLHAVLAAPRDRMLAHWQWAHGAAWTWRLGDFLDRVHETTVALGFLESEDRWCDAYVGAMALGLSRLAARRLDSEWRAIGFDGATTAELVPGAPAAPVAVAGNTFARRFAAVIFADFAGFSRLPDRQLPVFWAQFMRAISERLARFGGAILLKRTWGDALHLVLDSAGAAAEAACAIQACLEELRAGLPDPLSALELRLAAHYAPVFAGRDPVEDADTFFGTQLSFTARIEPVTPPGMIFVTAAFAAQLALERPDAFALEYAGDVQLAKGYAQSRLFGLRRAGEAG